MHFSLTFSKFDGEKKTLFLCHHSTFNICQTKCITTETEFKEFEPRLKYGWFHLKLYLIFQDLSRHSIETGF